MDAERLQAALDSFQFFAQCSAVDRRFAAEAGLDRVERQAQVLVGLAKEPAFFPRDARLGETDIRPMEALEFIFCDA